MPGTDEPNLHRFSGSIPDVEQNMKMGGKPHSKIPSIFDHRLHNPSTIESYYQGTRMMGGCMAVSGIRITASPSQNGSTVNDEITGPNQSGSESVHNGEHEE